MPLIHSSTNAARDQNIRTLMHDVGKSPHVASQAQALAIAYANQRRSRADGGANFGDISRFGDYESPNVEDRRNEDPDEAGYWRSFMRGPQEARDWRAGPHPDMTGDPMAEAAGYSRVGTGITFADVPLPHSRPKALHRAEGGGAPWYVRNE